MTPDAAEALILNIGEAAFARHLNYWVRTVLTDGESIRHFRAGIAVEARRAASSMTQTTRDDHANRYTKWSGERPEASGLG